MAKCWNDKFIKEKSYAVDNDRFKEKSYVYAPFPEANQHGFQDGEIRAILLADILARFGRMENKNVLFPTGFNSITLESFIESKKLFKALDDQSTDVFYSQMSALGVGINDGKCISMRHNEYLGILQNAFIELWERNYLKYKISYPYLDKENNKIYDYMEAPLGASRSAMKCFSLDIAGLIPQIIQDIKSLGLPEEDEEELMEPLHPSSVLKMELVLSNGATLDIDMEEPEYVAGISYIFINPNYSDISDYISHDEYGSVEEYLETEEGLYAYSGLTAKNPLTGEDIPVFISLMYPRAVYIGIPAIDEEDMNFALQEGFDTKEILMEGVLIHSDMLDGYEPEDARKRIIEAFIEADMAKESFVYKNSEIILSSLDPFGALIPFLEDKEKIHSLKEYLPYAFSSQFRPVLGENVDVPGSTISGTISHLFTEGMLPLLAIIYDNIGSIESIFSSESHDAFKTWLPIEYAFVPKGMMKECILMPLVFYNILKKEMSYNLPKLFENVVVLPKTIDIRHKSIRRKNNNLLNMDSWIERYGCDAIRHLCAYTSYKEEMIFDPYWLEDSKNNLIRMKTSLLSAVDDDVLSLDYHFQQLSSKAENMLKKGNISGYLKILEDFNEKVLFYEIISKTQALTYIRVIYPIFPCLAEEIYQTMFGGRYSIVNQGWPSEY